MVFDAHLMISDPDKFLPDLAAAGCDIITVTKLLHPPT